MKERIQHSLNVLNDRTRKIYEIFFVKDIRLATIISALVFFLSFILILNYIGVFKHISERPSSIHISAQCQRASIALNYYKTDMNFFKPRIQRYMVGEGITGVEFPIIYYMGAIMYKLFGFHEIYLRMISLIIVSIGLFCFYKLANNFIKDNIISAMLVISVALSPVFLIYTPNFMPDAPGMAMHLAAWFFFFEFVRTDKKRHLNLFIFFAAFATLLKATAVLIFIVIVCLLVLDKWRFFKTNERLHVFKDHKRIIKAVVIGILISSTWYVYASWLSKHYHYESFALRPIMIDSWEAFDKVVEYVKNLWMQYYYSYESYVLIVIALGMIILFMKYANRLLLTITFLNIFGSCFYIYFFLNQFRDHDYYMIALLPCIFFALLTMGEMVARFADRYLLMVRIVFIFVLFFNMKESVIYTKKKFGERNSRDIYYWAGDFRAYEDLEPKLRKAGIKRTDKTICAFDFTYCASLYLMDQIGATIGNETNFQEIDAFMKNPEVKYLVLNDSARFNAMYPNDLARKVLITHRGLIVYKLR